MTFNVLNVACLLCRAAEHTVDLPAVLVFPSWRKHTRPSTLSVSTSAEELLSHINTALLHPLVNQTMFSFVFLCCKVMLNEKYYKKLFLS